VWFATTVCMRLCNMGYMCHVDPYVYSLIFVSTWYMCEMAMELLSRYYHIRNSIMFELSMQRYVSSKLICVDAHI
jgi:hypothetical protein